MAKNRASRKERFFSTLIVLFFCFAVILVAAIVIDQKMTAAPDLPVQTAVSLPEETAAPLTLRVETTQMPAQTASETQTPEATPTAEAPQFEFLPIYTRAETDEKVIAVTLDDCSQIDNLRSAVVLCQQTNAKLTLFPLGQAVMKDGMRDALKLCVEQLGYEVENRTWSNAALYQLDDAQFASEIWTADIAVDYLFGADYDMHFFRMRGGSGTRDTRTHTYLKQLGYDAIVTWTAAASDYAAEDLCATLAPGNIYLFSTKSEDLEKLAVFLPYAQEQGYRFATLNELLGYEDNVITPIEGDILSQTLPALEKTDAVYTEQKLGDRTWQVYLIQSRLAELGYLPSDGADGMYGYSTSAAVSEFQAGCGLLGTGVADAATQTRLFAADAPAKPSADLFS